MRQNRWFLLGLLLIGETACMLAAPRPTATLEPAASVQPAATIQPAATLAPTDTATPLPTMTEGEAIMAAADLAVHYLQARDMVGLATLVHAEQGLRFSPYAYVREEDRVFTAEQVGGLFQDATVYAWGAFDGSGEPIEMTFTEYFERFVYDQDYAAAERVSLNERLGQGNTLDNALEFYPGGAVVEYHFPGFDPAYEGLDWRSLRLMFVSYEGDWALVGIIHDEWTI